MIIGPDGTFLFCTIMPAVYSGRRRHYHVKIQTPGSPLLTTQRLANVRDGQFERLADPRSLLQAWWYVGVDFPVPGLTTSSHVRTVRLRQKMLAAPSATRCSIRLVLHLVLAGARSSTLSHDHAWRLAAVIFCMLGIAGCSVSRKVYYERSREDYQACVAANSVNAEACEDKRLIMEQNKRDYESACRWQPCV